MIYESLTKAAKVTVVFAIGATALWFIAVPVTEGWLKAWMAQPPVDIPLWKRYLMSFARGWPIVWPLFVVLVWVFSLLIELLHRVTARRP